jgi:hypothetical protein
MMHVCLTNFKMYDFTVLISTGAKLVQDRNHSIFCRMINKNTENNMFVIQNLLKKCKTTTLHNLQF